MLTLCDKTAQRADTNIRITMKESIYGLSSMKRFLFRVWRRLDKKGFRLFLEEYNDWIIKDHFKDFIDRLHVYYPASANYFNYPDLTFSAANNLPQKLLDLIKTSKKDNEGRQPDIIEVDSEPTKLGALFDEHYSDKGSYHGYDKVYSVALTEILSRKDQLNLLEIGIGTNNISLVSTMGRNGTPGASLRAFRDVDSRIMVYGADIDRDILFSESRIKTAFVDQLNLSSLKGLVDTLKVDRFDVVIDDGLHSIEANLNSLIFAIDVLDVDGWFFVEDIPERSLIVWKLVSEIIAAYGQTQLVRCENSYVFVFRRKSYSSQNLSKRV